MLLFLGGMSERREGGVQLSSVGVDVFCVCCKFGDLLSYISFECVCQSIMIFTS